MCGVRIIYIYIYGLKNHVLEFFFRIFYKSKLVLLTIRLRKFDPLTWNIFHLKLLAKQVEIKCEEIIVPLFSLLLALSLFFPTTTWGFVRYSLDERTCLFEGCGEEQG